MVCNRCGRDRETKDTYCTHCGADFSDFGGAKRGIILNGVPVDDTGAPKRVNPLEQQVQAQKRKVASTQIPKTPTANRTANRWQHQIGQWKKENTHQDSSMVSPKKKSIALILCLCLGFFGVHRFYAGKHISGVLYIFTYGFYGLGIIFDLAMILTGKFKDGQGRIIA